MWLLGNLLQGRMVLPDVQYGMLELRIEIDVESAVLELVGLEKRV